MEDTGVPGGLRFVGIDPGFDGCVAVIGPDGAVETVVDTPTLNIGKGKQVKRVYDEYEMYSILRRIAEKGPCRVYLEQVHAMPGQGVTSMFRFGEGFGLWKGLLTALGLPREEVAPARWKGALMRDMGKEKSASIVAAKRLFPDAVCHLSRVKDSGRADAILIAEYGRRISG